MTTGIIESLAQRIDRLERSAAQKPSQRIERFACVTKLADMFGVSRAVMSEAVAKAVAARRLTPKQFGDSTRKLYSVEQVEAVLVSDF